MAQKSFSVGMIAGAGAAGVALGALVVVGVKRLRTSAAGQTYASPVARLAAALVDNGIVSCPTWQQMAQNAKEQFLVTHPDAWLGEHAKSVTPVQLAAGARDLAAAIDAYCMRPTQLAVVPAFPDYGYGYGWGPGWGWGYAPWNGPHGGGGWHHHHHK